LSGRASNRPPLSPKEAWLSDGRQVLHFRPSRWGRWSQQLEVTVGELLPDQSNPSTEMEAIQSEKNVMKELAELEGRGEHNCQSLARHRRQDQSQIQI